ncbi:unnamed protein product [Cladocopium goreaui]|uniref:Uncharacterized protein n=1 Tax=Cladocopium goreaui TaxID=2562237 RepID=A0A9P1G6X6_9DINO|nr:unnamed protein product [Cladocopium goreaui]
MSVTDASFEQSCGHIGTTAKEQWMQLPSALRRDLGSEFCLPDPEFLYNVCLDDLDRHSLVSHYASDAAELEFFTSILKTLQVQSSAAASLCRKRRAAVHPSLQWLAVCKQPRMVETVVPPVDSLEWLCHHSGAHKRARIRVPKNCPNSRADAELSSQLRWQRKLATILIDSCAPALSGATGQTGELRALRLAGNTRSSTLKKHIQMWHRYSKWLHAAYQLQWPTTCDMVLDFLEELAAQPCGKTVPEAFCATLQFMERVAGIALEFRLGKQTAVLRTVEQLSAQLETGAPPSRKARPQPLILILALELWVMNISEEGMCFERDYLVPLPTKNRESCVQFMADYTAMCALSKELYCLLRRPVFQWQQWSLTDEPLLIAPSACRAWTEHSERCWLASVAAVLDIGRERREVLGRWRVASCSDEYIRTAQRVVSQVQRAIVGGVLNDTEWQLQEIGIKDLEIHLRQAGESDSLIYNQLCAFDLSLAGWCGPVRPIAAHAAPDSPKPMENACNVAEVSAVAVGVESDEDDSGSSSDSTDGSLAASPDLKYHLSEVKVPVEVQAALFHKGFVDLQLFAGLDESRLEVRNALAVEIGLKHDECTDARQNVARLLSAWESSRAQLVAEDKMKAESKLGQTPRIVQCSEMAALRKAVEADLGKLQDDEVPAKSLIATKLEQIESGDLRAEDLREVLCVEDTDVDLFSGIIEHGTGNLKIKPGKASIAMPSTPEELRLRHRRIGIAWLMVGSKHKNQSWITPALLEAFRRFSDHIVGRHIAGFPIMAQGVTRHPAWNLVLSYELEVRKRAYKQLRDGKHSSLQEALEDAWNSAELINKHFLVPLTASADFFSTASHGEGPNRLMGPARNQFCQPKKSVPRFPRLRSSVDTDLLDGEEETAWFHQAVGGCGPPLNPCARHVKPIGAQCFAGLQTVLDKHTDGPLVKEAREAVKGILRKHGAQLDLDAIPERQPFHLALLEEFLRLCNDPDASAYFSGKDSFAAGVSLGVNQKMPRTPAAIEAQFVEEAKLGAMVKMEVEEASRIYGENLRVASLGAIRKADDSFRVVHDGAHGIGVNGNIKVRDQIACPSAGDLRQVLQVLEKPTFVLTADIKRAHRLVKIKPEDWGLQACRTDESSSFVWLNTVGTFGVASAAVHWSHLFSGIQRAVCYLTGTLKLFLLTYVDDLLFITQGKAATDAIVVALLFMVVLGVPLSWHKCKGGTQVEWVGYYVDLEQKSVGISEKRADWICNWVETTVAAGVVKLHDFSAVLGRLSFAMAAIEHLRPFLGPLYAWSAALENVVHARLPKAVIYILRFIEHMLKHGWRTRPVGPLQEARRELFRADAKAEGEVICIGGWAVEDGPDTKSCRWFSERLTRSNAPWAFLAGESFRAIASLELFATLVSLVLFKPACYKGSMKISAGTDNLGNTHLIARLMSTKFPLCAILMEVAAVLMDGNHDLQLEWLPRLQNQEADNLTNEIFHGFSEDRRLRFRMEEYEGLVLQAMLNLCMELYEDVRKARDRKVSQTKRVKTGEPLRVRDPWG